MRVRNTFAVLLVCLLFAGSAFAQIKVACMGDSITAGDKLKNRNTQAYPARLAELMGGKYDVKNFGASGRTLLREGKESYFTSGRYRQAKDFNADIITLKLGTNDSKLEYWKRRGEMEKDLNLYIDEFRKANSKVKIYLCLPVPVYRKTDNKRLRDKISNERLKDILPIIRKVAEDRKTGLIDLNTPLLNHPEYFPDGIHPNEAGALVIAKEIHKALTEKGQ
ncbi:GDSL-type esterase/lipase family protein [Verrucomicrobiota bacterium]